MLKFESWPPEAGKVTFTDTAKKLFRVATGGNAATQWCGDMGKYAGDLLSQNAGPETAIQIIEDLTAQVSRLRSAAFDDEGPFPIVGHQPFHDQAIEAIERTRRGARA